MNVIFSELILSVFWTFSFAGILGIQLTALAVAVIPLVVGLGIDFAVHISRRYQEGLKVGNSVEESLLDAQLHTGQALTLAMFTTVLAFLSGISAGVGAFTRHGEAAGNLAGARRRHWSGGSACGASL